MEQDVPKRIYQSRPHLVLNIGNEYLSFLLMENLKQYYENSSLNMPKRHLFQRFIKDLKEYSMESIDFVHHTTPIRHGNANGFRFPGDYVGQYGAYQAVEHVYQSTAALRPLLKDNYLMTNQRYFAADMERAVQNIRVNFREQQKIDPAAYSIFVAPGNEKQEVDFCLENLRKGVKEFLLKYSSPSSLNANALPLDGNFVTVISVHAGSAGEAAVKEYLAENEWTGRTLIVTDENNQHYDAMAASDFGFIFDGQMVSAANALHLPTNCIINMRMHHQFVHDYVNRW